MVSIINGFKKFSNDDINTDIKRSEQIMNRLLLRRHILFVSSTAKESYSNLMKKSINENGLIKDDFKPKKPKLTDKIIVIRKKSLKDFFPFSFFRFIINRLNGECEKWALLKIYLDLVLKIKIKS